jgi:hypothetical protein
MSKADGEHSWSVVIRPRSSQVPERDAKVIAGPHRERGR